MRPSFANFCVYIRHEQKVNICCMQSFMMLDDLCLQQQTCIWHMAGQASPPYATGSDQNLASPTQGLSSAGASVEAPVWAAQCSVMTQPDTRAEGEGLTLAACSLRCTSCCTVLLSWSRWFCACEAWAMAASLSCRAASATASDCCRSFCIGILCCSEVQSSREAALLIAACSAGHFALASHAVHNWIHLNKLRYLQQASSAGLTIVASYAVQQ